MEDRSSRRVRTLVTQMASTAGTGQAQVGVALVLGPRQWFGFANSPFPSSSGSWAETYPLCPLLGRGPAAGISGLAGAF